MPLAVVSPRVAPRVVIRALGVLLLAASLAASLAACGSSSGGRGSSSSAAAQRGSYKIGQPYKIDGVTYTPQESFNHVETGVASWYGPGFHGKSTANGEQYNQADRTAAHRTLQMPSIVRVTNLDNGLSTVVRINDRGPFARSRVIDLSRTAAQEIDIVRNGTGRVRLEQLTAESLAVKDVAIAGGGPTEQNAAVLQASAGQRIPASAPPPIQVAATAQPTAAPPPPPVQAVWPTNPRAPAVDSPQANGWGGGGTTVASLATAASTVPAPVPAPAVQPASLSGNGGFYVQTGAFTTPENAERQRGAVRSYGVSEVSQGSSGGRDVWRVRLGPYTTPDAAGIVADRLKRSGYGDARVVSD